MGAGKMGEGIIVGLLKSGLYRPDDIKACEIIEKRCQYIMQTYKVECLRDAKKAVTFADICLIAVKPGEVAKVLEQIGPVIKPGQLLVSIAAGVTLDFYRKHLPIQDILLMQYAHSPQADLYCS
jgi:pyrroline-5-carboxylate reductase